MELRVIVIAVISTIIVSMSFLVQGQSSRPSQNQSAKNEIDLLNRSDGPHALPLRASAARSSTDPWNEEDGQDELDEFILQPESNSKRPSDWDSSEESESLEPDFSLNQNLSLPSQSACELSEAQGLHPAAIECPVIVKSEPVQAMMTAESMDPLATVWDSSATNDFAQTTLPTERESIGWESVAQISPTPDDGATAPAEIAVPEVAPAAELVLEQVQEAPVPLATAVESTATRDIPPSVAQIARNHMQYGNSLARRGSLFSARQEFFSALRLIVESLDLVNGVATHRAHYGLAIVALKEAEDFVDSPGDDVSSSVARIVELHQSKILGGQDVQSLPPMAAMQAYFAFAQKHFSAACADSRIASELLFSLGKLHSVKALQDPSGQPTDLAISILMHQSALNVDPNNYLSANELGVALARFGYYEPARAVLLHSVSIHPTAEAWLNLSIVHRELGETKLADLALAENKGAGGAESRVARRTAGSLAGTQRILLGAAGPLRRIQLVVECDHRRHAAGHQIGSCRQGWGLGRTQTLAWIQIIFALHSMLILTTLPMT